MVSHELPDGQVSEAWETITGPADLLTPVELYASLKAQGFLVDYARIPITDGRAPKARDFDSLAWRIAMASREDSVLIFSCQAGHGRTTLGTVVGCLMFSQHSETPGVTRINSMGKGRAGLQMSLLLESFLAAICACGAAGSLRRFKAASPSCECLCVLSLFAEAPLSIPTPQNV